VAWGTPEGTWHPQIASLPLSAVTALAYADGWLIAGGTEGVARSSDGGRSWRGVELPGTSSHVVALASSSRFAEDSTILAALCDNGILRSTDAGRSWHAANFGLHCFAVTALAWGPDEVVLAATSEGIYRSPNGGRAWRRCRAAEGEAVAALAWFADGSALAALESGALLRSIDGGESWKHWRTAPPEALVNALWLDNEDVLLGTSAGLLRFGIEVSTKEAERSIRESGFSSYKTSTTDGDSQPVVASNPAAQGLAPDGWQCLHAAPVLCISGSVATRYIGTPEGLLVDNGTLQMLPPPPIHDLRHLVLMDTKPLVIGSHMPPAVSQGEQGWQTLSLPVVPLSMFTQLSTGSLFCAGGGGFFRSCDSGQHWQQVYHTAAAPIQYLSGPSDGRIWAAGSTGPLISSDDDGLSWQTHDWPFGVLPLAALQATPSTLFAATYDKRLNTAQIWRSTDAGVSWLRGASVQTRWPLVRTHHEPACLALGDTLFVERQSGEWEQTRVGGGVRRIIGDMQRLIVLSESGLWQSRDLGERWQRIDAGLPLAQTLDIVSDGAHLYALLTGGRVVWTELADSRSQD
jgi:photosystem II stability/assembly factor-like uncharacterized protein